MRIAKVSSVYMKGGAPVCDIGDSRNPSAYQGCPILLPGSGLPKALSSKLPRVGSYVGYAIVSGSAVGAVVFGTISGSAVGALFRAPDAPAVDLDGDYPTIVDLEDYVERNAGAVWTLTKDGQIVLDTTESGESVRVQLSDDGTLRISRGGEEPTARLLLASPSRGKLDELVNQVNALQAQVALLTVTCQAVSLAAYQAAASIGTTPPLGVAEPLFATTVGILAIVPAVPSYVPTPVLNTGNELESGAILISDQSTVV